MKEFSDYEKVILGKIVEIEGIPGGLNVLGNILDFELYPNFYITLNSETDCSVIIKKTYLDNIANTYGNLGVSEITKQLNNKFLFVAKLFEYLEREGQIYLTDEIDLPTLGSKFGNREEKVSYPLEDKETVSLIYRIAKKRIVPNDSLIHFVKNNFKTDSEIKAEQEQRNTSRKINWTAFGVIVSLIGILLTNVLKIVEMNKTKGIDRVEIINDKLKISNDRDTTYMKISIDKFNDTLNVKSDNKVRVK
jgi:hypothetical protein